MNHVSSNELAIKICTAIGVSTDLVSSIEILPLVPGGIAEIRIERCLSDEEATRIIEILRGYKWELYETTAETPNETDD